MSGLGRPPVRIGRAQRSLRDDRVFLVATDDTFAPKQYFEHLPLPRVKVVVLNTPEQSGLSSPAQVVERLKNAFDDAKRRNEIQADDEFWVLLDTDHNIQDSHLKGMTDALRTGLQADFSIAVSNPCFELWLLLHHREVTPDTVFSGCAEVEQQLREALGQYNKTSIKPSQFPLASVSDAIRRARALESSPDSPLGRWPESTGTRVYQLLERILQGP